jgi:hypothetical protein
VVIHDFLDALSGESLPHVRSGLAGVAVVEKMAVAESFQGAGFLPRHPNVAGDSECLGVVSRAWRVSEIRSESAPRLLGAATSASRGVYRLSS